MLVLDFVLVRDLVLAFVLGLVLFAAGVGRTALLRRHTAAVACGENFPGQCALQEPVGDGIYAQITVGGARPAGDVGGHALRDPVAARLVFPLVIILLEVYQGMHVAPEACGAPLREDNLEE